jgi:predicted CxxxxCH...CXXCH cytochrome family protein
MRPLPSATSGLAAALITAALIPACEIARDTPPAEGQHPEGWIDPMSQAFHGRTLRAGGDDLTGCRVCHGGDDAGGPVGVSCKDQGCHDRGVEFCGTCHGDRNGPRPATGAHALHGAFCGECHRMPSTLRATGHVDGTAQVIFSGLAVAGGAKPAWDPAAQRCSGTYCHHDASPTWKSASGPAPCDACHGAPPASHARWAHVASGPASCAACHPAPPSARHLDGLVQVDAIACDGCHGHGPLGAPAPALDGSTDPKARGVGAHRRHLDETLADRIGRAVPCEGCHDVPASVTAPGHLDTSAPANVSLATGGAYDASAGRCVSACHFDRDPGPSWTDTSGAARACDACHAFPPTKMRSGAMHTVVPADLGACVACHPFDPSTHVDGIVDLLP